MEIWDPFAQATSLRDAMDRLLQESIIRPSGALMQRGAQAAMLPLDVHESEDSYTIQASLPGVKPEDVQIHITGDTITIRGESQESREERRGEQVIMRERRMGSFARTITLPLPVDSEHAEAKFENGVLTLRLPKAPQAKPRRITVSTADGKQAQQMGQGTTASEQEAGLPQASGTPS